MTSGFLLRMQSSRQLVGAALLTLLLIVFMIGVMTAEPSGSFYANLYSGAYFDCL